MYTLEKNDASPSCILCILMPQIIPLLTLTLVCMWYEESNPRVQDPIAMEHRKLVYDSGVDFLMKT